MNEEKNIPHESRKLEGTRMMKWHTDGYRKAIGIVDSAITTDHKR